MQGLAPAQRLTGALTLQLASPGAAAAARDLSSTLQSNFATPSLFCVLSSSISHPTLGNRWYQSRKLSLARPTEPGVEDVGLGVTNCHTVSVRDLQVCIKDAVMGSWRSSCMQTNMLM